MESSQQETLAQLKRRLADIQAGVAAPPAADRPKGPETVPAEGTAPRRKRARPRSADPGRSADSFKEGGYGEEASPDEPWAEPDAVSGKGKRRSGKRPRGVQGAGGARPAGSRPDGPDAEGEGPEEQALTPEEAYAEAKAIVLRQLTAAPKSRRQLETKLAEREIPEDAAAAVLDRFEEVQLVDDAEFARMWVRSRSQSKSLARGALRRELSEKGIAPDLAAEALEQLSADDELEAARALARRKLQASADLSDRAVRDKQTRRLVGMLARKGYSPSLGFRVAGEIISEVRDARGDSV